MTKRIFTLDSQILSAIQSCELYAHLKFDQNLTSPVGSRALQLGKAFHVFAEHYYNNKVSGLSFEANVAQTIELSRIEISQSSLDLSEINLITKVFRDYSNYYKGEKWIPLQVEQVFSDYLFQSEDLDIIYNCKIDLVVDSDIGIIPVDHKTTSRVSPIWRKSNQFLGYCWALKSKYLEVNRVRLNENLIVSERFKRISLFYSDTMVEEWKFNSIQSVIDYIDHRDKGIIKDNPTACQGIYGPCEFLEHFCDINPELREDSLKMNFIVGEKWDVGKGL